MKSFKRNIFSCSIRWLLLIRGSGWKSGIRFVISTSISWNRWWNNRTQIGRWNDHWEGTFWKIFNKWFVKGKSISIKLIPSNKYTIKIDHQKLTFLSLLWLKEKTYSIQSKIQNSVHINTYVCVSRFSIIFVYVKQCFKLFYWSTDDHCERVCFNFMYRFIVLFVLFR